MSRRHHEAKQLKKELPKYKVDDAVKWYESGSVLRRGIITEVKRNVLGGIFYKIKTVLCSIEVPEADLYSLDDLDNYPPPERTIERLRKELQPAFKNY